MCVCVFTNGLWMSNGSSAARAEVSDKRLDGRMLLIRQVFFQLNYYSTLHKRTKTVFLGKV